MLEEILECQMAFLSMAKVLLDITLLMFLKALTMKQSMSSPVSDVQSRLC